MDPLRAFLSGKRKSERHVVSLPVTVSGVKRECEATAVDLSNGGVLLSLSEQELRQASARRNNGYLQAIQDNFRDGFDVHFPSCRVVVEAELVRMSVQPGEDGLVFLGCRFRHALSMDQRTRLGLAGTVITKEGVDVLPTWLEVAPMEHMPYEPRPGRQTYALVYDRSDGLSGPRYAARVTGLGEAAVCIRIDHVELSNVTQRLGNGSQFRVSIVQGNKQLWASDATLVAARYLDTPGGGVEVALLADEPPGRNVTKHFRKRKRGAA